jgi:hypothetical protein
MSQKPKILFVYAAIALGVFAPFAFGQQTAKLPKLNPFMKPTKDPNTEVGARLQAEINSVKSKANMNAMSASKTKGPQLQTFTYQVTSTRDGNVYSGQIVGKSPFSDPQGKTSVSAQLAPLVIVTNSVFAGVDSAGMILTAPGVTVFDPTIPDDSCSSAPNDVPLKLVQQSPIFLPFAFNFGGTDMGTVQTTDAFQRGNFFQLISHGQNANGITYQVVLDPLTTAAKIVVNIPAADGVAYPSAAFVGGCPTGKFAVVDIAVYEPAIISLFTQLAAQGVNPSTFPFYLLHNVVQCEGNTPGCATLNSGACCILGFHDASGAQTFGSADFDTSGIFGSAVQDVSDMSHEVAEWMNDPFGNNPVPAWGHIGQQPGCQGNLEVGDPLSGTFAPPIFNPKNGFTYHLQELAFFSWFYGSPSVGVNSWFSNNATFLTDAGPVCTP